jgi:hypothetical protein
MGSWIQIVALPTQIWEAQNALQELPLPTALLRDGFWQ